MPKKDKCMNIRVDAKLHGKLSYISNQTGLSIKSLVDYCYSKTFGDSENIVLNVKIDTKDEDK